MSEYCDLKIQYIRGFWVWWEYLEIYSITVYLVKGLLMNHSLERYTFKGAILPSTSLLIRFSLFSSVNDSQSVICQNCGSTEWGSSYTDTNIDPAPCPSFTTLGCIEQGRTVWNVEVLYIIKYIVTENTYYSRLIEQACKGVAALSVKYVY